MIVPGDTSADPILLLDEQGADIEWRQLGDTQFLPIANRPPRLGRFAIEITSTMQVEVRALQSGLSTATLICNPTAAERLLPSCLVRAATVALAANDSLSNGESDPSCAAFMEHAIAHASSLAENAERAELHYRNAIQRWDTLGDKARAAAAWLGLTEQLIRRQKFADAITAAATAERRAKQVQLPYFALRARQESCLAKRYLGEWQATIECLKPLPNEFLNIGEPKDAGNAAVNLGGVLRLAGELQQAKQSLDLAGTILEGVAAPLAQARMHELAGTLHSDSGHIGEAIRELNLAVQLFTTARNQLGEGNALLKIGALFLALDSGAEADNYFAEARKIFESVGAEERVAATRAAQAELWWLNSRLEDASRELDYAEETFSRLGMTMEGQWLQSKRLQFPQDPRSPSTNMTKPSVTGNSGQLIGNDLALATAKRALDSGDIKSTKSALQGLRIPSMTFSQWSTWQALIASTLLHDGQFQQAASTIEGAAAKIRALAQRGSSPLVRAMAMAQLSPLQGTWLDALSDMNSDGHVDMETIWRILTASDRGMAASDAWQENLPYGKHQTLFAQALTEAVLAEADRDDAHFLSVQQRLVAELGGEIAHPTKLASSDIGSLSEFQARLTDQQQLLWFAMGNAKTWVLSVTRNHVDLVQAADPQTLRQRTSKLLGKLTSPSTPERDVMFASEQLSVSLIPAALGAPAKRLLLVVDPRLGDVPFSLLHWPNTQGYLIENANLSYLNRLQGNSVSEPKPGTISVLVSATGPQPANFPTLVLAEREPDMISGALPGRNLERWVAGEFTEQRLDTALQREAGWVHVAAHGAVPSNLMGFSGIWVASEGTEAGGTLLSWVNLVEKPLRAQLVVLNACSLAGNTRDSSVQSTSTFARMLSVAGVENVVAARWEISDAATAIWVPTFYKTLGAQAQLAPGTALRDAQLRLRQSRHFRHPFYWAGFVHYTRGLD